MKLEKFDLEKALNGAKVVTREGREVTQLTKFEIDGKFPLHGVVGSRLYSWMIDGYFNENNDCSSIDLFLAVEPQRIWVNVYYHHDKLWLGSAQYNSLTEAKLNPANTVNMRYIKTIEITDETENETFNTKKK